MKRVVCFFVFVLFLAAFSPPARAAQKDIQQQQQEYYSRQLQQSGAEDLPDKLPDDARKSLEALGVEGSDWQSITSITPQGMFQQIISVLGGNVSDPLKASVSVIAVMLLCALLNGMKLSFGEKSLGGVIGMVGTLCICTVVIQPVVACISGAAQVIQAAAGFLLACVPVLVGIMIAAGQPASAGSYNLLMTAAGNVISLVSASVLVPLMNIFLALSIVAAVSPGINLNGLCGAINKTVKWILGLMMTVFSGLLTMHSIVAAAVDSASAKAAKFVVSSIVPVIGSALGEAVNTITGCVKVLKAGVSAFGLLAGIFIFLPIIVQCVLWLLTMNLCAGIGSVFDQKEITAVLKAVVTVLETLLALVLCCMTVLTVSTVIMLMIGGVGS
ncbi:MAG: stage III sporulation protein AE [Clostridiales bacterium]|nr:stage III sporulation protein AE [Clostridiales bacterium]